MNYKKLGTTDLNVSTICLGTMTWGERNSQEEGFEQMDYALDQGINFWDTAELYAVPPREETYGHTEIIIGNWFKKSKKRDKVILASKVAGPMRAYLRGGGNNYGLDKMTEAVNDSLKRLQTDYIDLYQLHWPERNTNMFGRLGYEHKENGNWNKFEDVLGNLKRFIDAGKIREIGLSNETPWGVSKYLELAKEKDLPRMMSIQNPYSLLNRPMKLDQLKFLLETRSVFWHIHHQLADIYLENIETINYLKFQIERDPDFWTRYEKPNTDKAVEAYYEISNKHGLDLAQMSLKFLEIQPFVTSVIIGATTMEQLKTNIESVNINISDDVIKEINKIQTIYPNPCP